MVTGTLYAMLLSAILYSYHLDDAVSLFIFYTLFIVFSRLQVHNHVRKYLEHAQRFASAKAVYGDELCVLYAQCAEVS